MPDGFLMSFDSSQRMTLLPARLLSQQHGNRPFRAILATLRSKNCRGKPAPVYVVAGHHREPGKGTGPDWSLVLVAQPNNQTSRYRHQPRQAIAVALGRGLGGIASSTTTLIGRPLSLAMADSLRSNSAAFPGLAPSGAHFMLRAVPRSGPNQNTR